MSECRNIELDVFLFLYVLLYIELLISFCFFTSYCQCTTLREVHPLSFNFPQH